MRHCAGWRGNALSTCPMRSSRCACTCCTEARHPQHGNCGQASAARGRDRYRHRLRPCSLRSVMRAMLRTTCRLLCACVSQPQATRTSLDAGDGRCACTCCADTRHPQHINCAQASTASGSNRHRHRLLPCSLRSVMRAMLRATCRLLRACVSQPQPTRTSVRPTYHSCTRHKRDGPSSARPIALPLLRRAWRDQYFFSRLIIQVWSLPLSPSVMPRYSSRVDRPCSVSNAAPMPTIKRLRSNALWPVR